MENHLSINYMTIVFADATAECLLIRKLMLILNLPLLLNLPLSLEPLQNV